MKYYNYTVMFLKDTIICGGNSSVWIKLSCPIAEQDPILKPCQQQHITDCNESSLRPTVWRHTCSILWRGETTRWAQGGEQGVHFNSYTMTFMQTVLQQCFQEVKHLTVDLFDVSYRLSLSSTSGAPRCMSIQKLSTVTEDILWFWNLSCSSSFEPFNTSSSVSMGCGDSLLCLTFQSKK